MLWTGVEEGAAFLRRHSASTFPSTSTPAWHQASPAWPATSLGHQFLADPGMWRGRAEESPWDHACADAPFPDDGMPHLVPQPLMRIQDPTSASHPNSRGQGNGSAVLGPLDGVLPPLLSSNSGTGTGTGTGGGHHIQSWSCLCERFPSQPGVAMAAGEDDQRCSGSSRAADSDSEGSCASVGARGWAGPRMEPVEYHSPQGVMLSQNRVLPQDWRTPRSI